LEENGIGRADAHDEIALICYTDYGFAGQSYKQKILIDIPGLGRKGTTISDGTRNTKKYIKNQVKVDKIEDNIRSDAPLRICKQ